MKASVKNELKRFLGSENASFSDEDRLCYGYDATGELFRPDGVVFPRDAGDVAFVLKTACAEGFAVVPRGAGSGFTGGSLPVRGGVVLSTERMNRIVEVDEANLTALVEPGVVTGELQDRVEALGLFYPPDPTSLKFCTIGGNIAECAGGPRAVKYGVTRDYVLGLEAVLPTGEIIETGTAAAKGVVGYDLTRLLVGSEGTLGVVTGARLRLVPRPLALKTLRAVFADVACAASAVAEITGARIVPCTLELMDGECIRCVEEYAGLDLGGAGAMLLIEVDGAAEAVEGEAARIAELCRAAGAVEVRAAADGAERRELWKARRAMSPALSRLRPRKINEDVVVPRARIVELVDGVREVAGRREVLIACFGHAGDGNIHVNVMIDDSDADEAARGEAAVRDVFELALRLGGTISGEHGIGTSKAPYLSMELSAEVVALMKRIKAAFDPMGVLNPGKVFPGEAAAGRAASP